MILARLCGGLGNQLFQYAAARRLSIARKTELKLDCRHCLPVGGRAPYRSYELDVFDLQASVATASELARFPVPWWFEWARWLRRGRCGPFVLERRFRFDPGVLELPDDVALVGFWQSERYFLDVADTIRGDLSFVRPLDAANGRVAAVIAGARSVAVHVRRGDYVSSRGTTGVHGPCSLAYYERAVARLLRRFPCPHFFVFSDEPAWARAHLRLPGEVTFVDVNGPGRGAGDLRLMSLCRHHVIANSSLSWWGAWLGAAPDKLVLAPVPWFVRGRLDTRELLPPSWERVDWVP